MPRHIGILAYGSLIDDPGSEIEEATVETLKDGIATPVKIEFGRKSRTRKGAPTLVPVEEGGATVAAQVFVLRGDISKAEASNRLYRRETDQVGKQGTYTPVPNPGPNIVIIEKIENFHGLEIVLFTRIAANISPLTAENLAALAIESVRDAPEGRDGITYLIAAKRNGIKDTIIGWLRRRNQTTAGGQQS